MTSEIRCPGCTAVGRYGDQFCLGCGAALVVPFLPESAAAPCGQHPHNLAVAACPRCGAFACPLCLTTTLRGEEVCRECERRRPSNLLPWDRRHEIGTLRAYWRTSMEVIQAPSKTFQAARPAGEFGSSFLFALLAHAVGMSATGLVYGLILAIGVGLGVRGAGKGGSAVAWGAGAGLGTVLAFLVLIPILGSGFLVVNAAVDHLILRLVGARPREWTVTLRASVLSLGPYLLGVIPLCSLYVAPWWAMVLKVLAYRSFHATTTGKAAAGALIFPLISMAVGLVGYLALLYFDPAWLNPKPG